jgi:hypothetical protein
MRELSSRRACYVEGKLDLCIMGFTSFTGTVGCMHGVGVDRYTPLSSGRFWELWNRYFLVGYMDVCMYGM